MADMERITADASVSSTLLSLRSKVSSERGQLARVPNCYSGGLLHDGGLSGLGGGGLQHKLADVRLAGYLSLLW